MFMFQPRHEADTDQNVSVVNSYSLVYAVNDSNNDDSFIS